MNSITSTSTISLSGQHALKLLQNAEVTQTVNGKTRMAAGGLQVSSSNDVGALVQTIIQLIMDKQGNTLLAIKATGAESTASAYTDDGNDTVMMDVTNARGVYTFGGDDRIEIKAESSTDEADNQFAVRVQEIYSGDGNDTIRLATGSTAAAIHAGAGDDTIEVAAAHNLWILKAGTGDDNVKVEAGNILLLDGGDGNDTIDVTARGRIDGVSGGKGNDTIIIDNQGSTSAGYYYALGDGHDVIATNGALEINAFNETATGRYRWEDARIEQNGNSVMIDFGNGADSIRINFTGEMATTEDYAFSYDSAKGSLVIHDATKSVADVTGRVAFFQRPTAS